MVRLYCSSYVIAILLSIRGTLSCDPDTGPAGKADCILDATYYSQYQCATCLSDAYIRQKSKGEQHCRNSSATYCYYDCMLEKYGLDSGPVYNDCLCDPNRTLPQPPVILPPACYSPDGTNCNWYRNCLARMFPCTGQVNYAIDYGEKFCKLYEKRLPHFSEQALRWISVVRRCLQVDLVPLLRLCQQHPTCEDIKATAFRSHAPCYLEPYQGFSICYLSVKDWVNIFITIHDSFRTDFIETMKSAVIVVGSCIGKLAEDLGEHIYSVAVYLSGSAPNLSDDEVAHSVILHVSSSLRWDNDSTVHWFAFAVNTSVAEYLLSTASADQQGRNLIIQVLVVDRVDTGLLSATQAVGRRRLRQTISDFANAITQGLSGTVGSFGFGVMSLRQCASGNGINDGCSNGTVLATGPPDFATSCYGISNSFKTFIAVLMVFACVTIFANFL